MSHGGLTVLSCALLRTRPGVSELRSAMPAMRAECLCPDVIFVPADFTRYPAVSRLVRRILKRHTDLLEPLLVGYLAGRKVVYSYPILPSPLRPR